jgi:hypothetical protein
MESGRDVKIDFDEREVEIFPLLLKIYRETGILSIGFCGFFFACPKKVRLFPA